MVDTYLLACNVCGRCCNSAPTLSLRELFQHRRRFVGALTIRRVPVLLAVAPVSAHSRVPCIDFIDDQVR